MVMVSPLAAPETTMAGLVSSSAAGDVLSLATEATMGAAGAVMSTVIDQVLGSAELPLTSCTATVTSSRADVGELGDGEHQHRGGHPKRRAAAQARRGTPATTSTSTRRSSATTPSKDHGQPGSTEAPARATAPRA
jgi:hypothetical protein